MSQSDPLANWLLLLIWDSGVLRVICATACWLISSGNCTIIIIKCVRVWWGGGVPMDHALLMKLATKIILYLDCCLVSDQRPRQNDYKVLAKHPLLHTYQTRASGKRPLQVSSHGVNRAASVQTYGSYIPGKRLYRPIKRHPGHYGIITRL